ncbi:eukaryotic translation initiation factor 2-alpha kinase-like protein 2 [Cucurbitaria berberidis CBS 394.84]|uniref:Eukaryotic translation initiation factor 2-alpha kinase-like protein 2 n=1 Tax=Cucurbitaria berberidis CBS 394.84 TaxID=1168544 RepID=A0A9P4G9D6_9PLEO|nr:eukaryotic translation initiation factor 2-alpha kinase-like protein 2 [Cucurbitaria berberidis CBS 394.84]KAF1841104.1 eukaryotic translation initiation factor 2-alpha kinase-like protein 2 [Cucurbitaria berberidis CBS 394.84]
MSMFRRPGDSSSSSSSSSEASLDQTDENEASVSQQDSVLSRINTLDSASPGGSTVRQTPPRLDMRQSSAQNVRDLMLHALLEERTVRQIADQLGKDPSDPEVQRLGREAYQQIARQISNNVDDMYASDEMQDHRATANEGISKLTKSNLSMLSVVPEGASQAIVARPPLNGMKMEIPQQLPADFEILSGLSAPTELHLRGYPGLQTDRYVREFSELAVVGKGGYGKVFKAKHKLDGSFYAVKRIPVSPAKLAKIQEHGPQELESMLEEVRSLARFDHNNIIRYHNAWLEFTTAPAEAPIVPTLTVLRDDRLLEGAGAFSSSPADVAGLPSQFGSLSFDDSLGRPDNGYSADIVFETSDNGMGAEESKSELDNLSLKEKMRSAKRKTRRGSQASQATIATVSSTKSRMSAVEDVDEDFADEDIETIPRSHMPYSQELSSDKSESMVSHSDMPGHMIPTRSSGPILTLNVQMSLCETNLSAFLSSEQSFSDVQPLDRHCFHPCISLEMLKNIVSGVEYLHSRGVVHRDLKPANVFLSLSTDRHPPYGSVDLSTCTSCPKRDCLHVTPRIGDFGLVAALSDECVGADTETKPVGTEFYRPQMTRGVSEKLDVFALGVVGFEMLHKFGTRMERVAALTNLRRGDFPDGFASEFGDMGNSVQQLIGDMVQLDEQKRLNCEQVKSEIGRLVHILKE